MALCVSLLLWLLSTIHVSLAADDVDGGGAPDPTPDSDPAPVVTVGNALTVKLHDDELTAKEDKKSHRLDPLQHLQDYETAGKLVDEHPKAVRIAEKEIKNPLGNFHVHLWAHLGSLPPAFCIPLEKEIPKLPAKPLLNALEEVLNSLINETAADPAIQEKVIEIIKPFEKFRNCCDKYFVFIDVKIPEFKPSEKSQYIWSKIAGHGVAGAPAVEPAIAAPQEPAVEEPERAGDAAPAPTEEPQEGGAQAGEPAIDAPQAGKEPKGDEPGEQPEGGGGAKDAGGEEPGAGAPEQGQATGGDQAGPSPAEEPRESAPTEEGAGAKEPAAKQDQKQPDEQDQEHQRKMAELVQVVNELYVCKQFQGQQFQDFPAFKASGSVVGTEINYGEFAKALEERCHKGVKVDPEMSERIFKTIDTNKDDQIKWKEWLDWREMSPEEQAKLAAKTEPPLQ